MLPFGCRGSRTAGLRPGDGVRSTRKRRSPPPHGFHLASSRQSGSAVAARIPPHPPTPTRSRRLGPVGSGLRCRRGHVRTGPLSRIALSLRLHPQRGAAYDHWNCAATSAASQYCCRNGYRSSRRRFNPASFPRRGRRSPTCTIALPTSRSAYRW